MLKRLFWKEAEIEIQPDGTRVQRWQRRSPRAWLLQKLVGRDRVIANLDLRGQGLNVKGEGRIFLFGNTLDANGSVSL